MQQQPEELHHDPKHPWWNFPGPWRNFDPIGIQEFHQFVSPRFVMGCRETARINAGVWEDKDDDMMIYGDSIWWYIYIYMYVYIYMIMIMIMIMMLMMMMFILSII